MSLRPAGLRGSIGDDTLCTGQLEGPVTTSEHERRKAARYVASRAQDVADLALLLDALGLDQEEAR